MTFYFSTSGSKSARRRSWGYVALLMDIPSMDELRLLIADFVSSVTQSRLGSGCSRISNLTVLPPERLHEPGERNQQPTSSRIVAPSSADVSRRDGTSMEKILTSRG